MQASFRDFWLTQTNQVAIFEDLMDLKALWLTPNSETVYATTYLNLKTDAPTVIELPINVLDTTWGNTQYKKIGSEL